MWIIALLFIGILFIPDLTRNFREEEMRRYCAVECKQNIRNKYKFCC